MAVTGCVWNVRCEWRCVCEWHVMSGVLCVWSVWCMSEWSGCVWCVVYVVCYECVEYCVSGVCVWSGV